MFCNGGGNIRNVFGIKKTRSILMHYKVKTPPQNGVLEATQNVQI